MKGITVTESEIDPNLMYIDLDNEALAMFEQALKIKYNEPGFEEAFNLYVNKALEEQLNLEKNKIENKNG